jgi:vancomycin resistance protein YoaR
MTQQDHSLTNPQPADVAARHRSRRRRGGLWRWLAVILATFALAAVGTVLAFGRAYDGQIVQNVTIRGLLVSGLGPEEARAALRERYADMLQAPLTLTFGERSWAPTAEEVGFQIAIDAAVDRAFAVGRGPDALANLLERGTLLSAGREIPLAVTLDAQRLTAYLAARVDELAVVPQDATLSIVEGQVITTPSASGRAISVEGIDATIRPGLLALEPQSVELTARELLPAMNEDGMAKTQARLETLLAQPATIQIGEEVRTWTPAELGALVRIERVAEAAGVKLEATLVSQPIAAWLAELAPALERAPVEPRLRWREGAVQISEPGTDGARLDQAAALTQITDALWQGQGQIAVGLSAVPPAIRPETLATLGIVELVAEGRSDFSGSAAYRVQNIRAGAAQMEGVLLAPGEEFSFNEHVGAINASNGFTEGYAIIQGRTQLEWGGGVCQVSTTVFRAAFWAGVPITERNQHSFRISWYEVYEPIGMDAAIFTGPGGYDFRFVNDTGSWLLMQTEVDLRRSRLTVRLYGTRPDREVIQTGPELTNERPAPQEPRYVADPELPPGAIRQTDTKRGGMDVRIGRIVRQNGQILYRDTFLSRYQPWPDIYALGPGATPPTPTPAATDPALAPTGQPEGVPVDMPPATQDTPITTPDAGLSEQPQPTPAPPEATPTAVP